MCPKPSSHLASVFRRSKPTTTAIWQIHVAMRSCHWRRGGARKGDFWKTLNHFIFCFENMGKVDRKIHGLFQTLIGQIIPSVHRGPSAPSGNGQANSTNVQCQQNPAEFANNKCVLPNCPQITSSPGIALFRASTSSNSSAIAVGSSHCC